MALARFRDDRIKAATAAIILEVALAYGLLLGLAMRPNQPPATPIEPIALLPSPEKPRPKPPRPPELRQRMPEREGAASPPNLRATPTEIVAPPLAPLPVPPPIVAAPVAGLGSAPSSGAAPVPGPGTGAGGIGNGTGSGAGGDGPGGGGQGGLPPRWLKGRLGNSDYPAGAGAAGVGGLVEVQYTVGTDGRVRNCRILSSSGNAELDEHTCRLIERRYRYAPARDRLGRPIDSEVAETHEWVIEYEPPSRDRR